MSDKITQVQLDKLYDIEPAVSSTLQVDNAAPTLAWNTTSVVGSVDGVDLTVKMPANPVPSSLKNPQSLTIKANSDSTGLVVYDGSTAKTFIIKPSTTAGAFIISDGTTEKTIQLAGIFTDNNTATAVDNILDGSNSGTAITYKPYTSQQSKLSFDTSSTNPTRTDRLNLNGNFYATGLYSDGSPVVRVADFKYDSDTKTLTISSED